MCIPFLRNNLYNNDLFTPQGRILAAPFVPVLFADFWLADQWNSFAAAFLDFHYLVAFYASGSDWFNVDSECKLLTYLTL